MEAQPVTRMWRCEECQTEWIQTADTPEEAAAQQAPLSKAHAAQYHDGPASISEVTPGFWGALDQT